MKKKVVNQSNTKISNSSNKNKEIRVKAKKRYIKIINKESKKDQVLIKN